MAKPISPKTIQPWIKNRIIEFFNRAKSVSEIVDTVKDWPADGKGTAIGHIVAKRILLTRSRLPWRRFRELEEIMEIKGVGQDKLEDMVFTFGKSAAQTFVDNMYDNNVISRENWPLIFHSQRIEPYEEFEETVRNEAVFRSVVQDQLKTFCAAQDVSEVDCQTMIDGVADAYIDPFNNTDPVNPAYAFAQWFYRIDLGNFFFFETGVPQTQSYFDHFSGSPWEMELRLFKGVRSTIISGGLVPPDLATVVNFPEQIITIWSTSLFD